MVQTNKKLILTAIFIFTLAVGFGFFNIGKASANSCVCLMTDELGRDIGWSQPVEKDSKEDCKAYCRSSWSTDTFNYNNEGPTTNSLSQGKEIPFKQGDAACVGVEFFSFKTWFNCFMLIVLQFLALILEAVSYLFTLVVDPAVFQTVVGNNTAIYTTWAMVRDTLNIAFILVLLFSAFCTVFQIEKYNYKKILITLIIMALLVNFSFPIARVIIDFSNVIMYYFISNLGIGEKASSVLPAIAKNSFIANIITESDASVKANSVMLVASVVFMFILVVTVFVITILLLIRMVVLAFLIIFSSIAFVGSIVPFLSTHASKWWDNLFKYSFFGPLMVFMIFVSMQMMTSTKGLTSKSSPGTIESMALFSLPIVILLAGLMVAKNMSIMGASAITGMASKFITGAGKKFSGANFVTGTWGAYQTRRKEAGKDSWANRSGSFLASKQDQLRGQLPGRGGRDAQLRYQRDEMKKIKDESERQGTEHMGESEARTLTQSRDKYARAAGYQRLAELGRATQTDMNGMRASFGETSQAFRQMVNKVKVFNPAIAFAHIADVGQRDRTIRDFVNSKQFSSKELSAASLSADPAVRAQNAEVLRIAAEERSLNSADFEELRKKNTDGVRTLIGDVATTRDPNTGNYLYTDMDNYVHREIQMAHVGQTGRFSDAINGNSPSVRRVLRESNENTLKRLDASVFATNPTFENDFEQSISQAKLSKILPAMAEGPNSATVARRIINHLRRTGGTHATYMTNNPNLAGLNP